MKTFFYAARVTFLLLVLNIPASLFAQGTAFAYQGRLNSGNGPANGTYDFRFRLAADPLANNYVGSPYFTNGITVSNGLFATTMDFGPGILNGSNYWLEIDVRTNGTLGYTDLTPLQQLTPTPYAVFANSSSNLLGVLPSGQLSGPIPNGNLPASPTFSGTVTATTFTGNGINVSNVNALALNGLSSTNFWQLGGNYVNPGQFLGSTNNQPVEIWADGQRAMRFEPNASVAPNVIGGSSANYVGNGVVGATISGGGATNYPYYWDIYMYTNSVTGDFGTVGGGAFNSAGNYSFVGGGLTNNASGFAATISGGQENIASAAAATVGGGYQNTASGGYESTVAGGYQNTASAYYYPTIGGGANNTASGGWSTVAGGLGNTAGPNTSYYPTVGGGNANTAGGSASTVSGGLGNIASGDGSFIGGGGYDAAYNPGNQATGKLSVVVGGVANFASGYIATIGGGQKNTNNGNVGTIAGGQNNSIPQSLYQPTIGGGYGNIASNLYSTVPGGILNIAGGADSFAAGQQAQALHQGSFVWADSQNSAFASTANDQFNVRAQGGVRFVTSGAGLTVDGFPMLASGNGSGITIQNNSSGAPTIIEGSPINSASVAGATISGGGATNYNGQVGPNTVLGDFGTISGGFSNTVTGTYGTVGGGRENTAYSTASTVAGGFENFAGQFGAVGGGESNIIAFTTDHVTIAGGNHNKITGYESSIGGGYYNLINAQDSVIAGGDLNVINSGANQSFIGGGVANTNNGSLAAIGGGQNNAAGGTAATIPGGEKNIANGNFSFAAGQQAQALHQGTFVWADSQNATFSSTINDEFSIRANGGVRIQSDTGIHLNANDRPIIVRDWDPFTPNAPSYKAGIGRWGLFMEPTILTIGIPDNITGRYFQIAKYSTNGNYTTLVLVDQAGDLYATNNVFAKGVQLTSDRNAKEHFAPLDAQSVLAKVTAMPVTEWNYKSDDADTKHIGPVAQDFHAAFGLNGPDDKHISAVDESGVALAAIQGLNQKVETLTAENEELKQRNNNLARQLANLAEKVEILEQKR